MGPKPQTAFKANKQTKKKPYHKAKTHKYYSPSFSFVQYVIVLNNSAFKIFECLF